MKAKKLLPIFLSAAACTFGLSGCSDYDNGYTSNEIQYKQSFKETFGKIDPTQDWNLATRATVTVTTNSSTNVKIYALTDGKYKLVADYADVTGTKELGFDVREDVTDLMVTNGSTSVKAKVGESVSFGTTRAGHYGTTGDIKVTEITDENSWFVFDLAESKKYQQKLPENVDNLGKVTQNFTFISNGEFTVYPIYWQTDNTDDIGIYFTDATGYHEIPIYTNKSGDELQYQEMTGHDPAEDSSHPGLSVGDECPYHPGKKILYLNHEGHKGSYYIYCENNSEWKDAGSLYQANSKFTPLTTMEAGWDTYVKNYRSKGVKVSIPAGTLFGMYIEPSDGVKQYSQQEKNSSIYSTAPTKDVVAATFTLPSTSNPEEDDMYLCFEDWQTSSCDKDLNDIVFRFYGSTPTVVDEDPDAWVICAEDLGNTFDIDYNDVVVEVKHVSGKTTTTVSPIAAGGTLASYIYFEDATEGEKCIGEIHELLGQSNTVSGSYDPYNVYGSVNTSNIKDRTFNVSETWSIASSTVGDGAFDQNAASMGGFSVRVVPAGTQASQAAAEIDGQKIQNSTDSGDENVPYVFCVPRNYTRNYQDGGNTVTIDAWFRWSNEMKSLYPLDGYGTGTYSTEGHAFAEWVANKNNAKDWYQYPNYSNTTGVYYVMSMVDNNPPHIDPADPVTPDPVVPTSTQLTESDDELTYGDGYGYDNYAIFSTSNLPTEGNVIFSVEINKGTGYINNTSKGIWKSSDGTNFEQISVEDKNYKPGNTDGVVEYTIAASEYATSTYLKIITDSGLGAKITKVSYKKIAQ